MIDRESIYELQKIDCNCNDCKFMNRDMATFSFWEEWHRTRELSEFEKSKQKAYADALAINDEKSKAAMLRIVNKMTFQFDKSKLINYGKCLKFIKEVSFIPNTCMLETQECFVHRRD